jgi:hypothetical protein
MFLVLSIAFKETFFFGGGGLITTSLWRSKMEVKHIFACFFFIQSQNACKMLITSIYLFQHFFAILNP